MKFPKPHVISTKIHARKRETAFLPFPFEASVCLSKRQCVNKEEKVEEEE
jgi:hypothetical protein